ncbi:hypothetical protein, partial [Serratia marcescens]
VGAPNRITLAYDYANPSLTRVALYRTLRASDGALSQGGAVTNVADFPLALTGLSSLRAKDVTDAYTGKFAISRSLTLFGQDSV